MPRSKRIAQSMQIGPGHKDAQRRRKIYDKGQRTDNPHEKEIFLKRSGPLLPMAKSKSSRRYS